MGMNMGGIPGMDLLSGNGQGMLGGIGLNGLMGSLNSQPGGGGGMFANNGGGLQLSQIPFIGGMFPNPNEAAMTQALGNAQNNITAYRPQMAQAFQNLAGQQLGALQPAQAALMQMYGGKPPPGPTISNPSPTMPGATGASMGSAVGSMIGGAPSGGAPSGGGGMLGGLLGGGGLGGLFGGGGLPGFGGGTPGPQGNLGGLTGQDPLLGPFGRSLDQGSKTTINAMTGPLGPFGAMFGGGLGGLFK